MSTEMNVEIESEVKVKMSYKYKEFNAVLFWSLQQFAAASIITAEQLEGCLTEMKLYSNVDEQIERLGEFADEKKDIIKAVTKMCVNTTNQRRHPARRRSGGGSSRR